MKTVILIIFLSLAFLFPLLIHPFYDSHDGENHLARWVAYAQAFDDGHFPPRWAGNLNFGYGTPVLLFFYPLPGYLASFIHLLGFSFQDIFKILISLSFIAAPLGFYLWTKLLFKKQIAFLGALLYGFAPYHFLNLYVRGDVAELMAFAFVPLIFLAIEKTIITKRLLFILLGGIFYGLLVLSHNGVSLMFSPVFLLYGLLRSGNKKAALQIIALLSLGLLLSAFFWLPALAEGKYTNAKLFIADMYKNHFPSLWQLLNPQWNFGPDVKSPQGLSPQIGFVHVGLALSGFFLFFKEKKQKKVLGFWVGIFLLGLFIVLPISTLVWQNISLLRLYEFPWRFIGLVSFATAIIACYVLDKLKENKFFISFLLIIFFFSCIPMMQVSKWASKPDSYYKNFTGTTYYHGEASPMWAAGDPGTFAKQQIEVIGGKAEVSQLRKKTHEHMFNIAASESATILDNTYFFPGWKIFVEGTETPIQFQDPNHRGLLTFSVPQGNHKVQVIFTETKLRKLADVVSVVSLLIVVILFGRVLIYNKKVKSA